MGYKDDLVCDIKKNVADFTSYFQKNYDRYSSFFRMVFQSSLDAQDIAVAQLRKMPMLEFNILEPFVSRLRAEFMMQEPSCMITSAPGAQNVDTQLISMLEAHWRAFTEDANHSSVLYQVYTDCIAGGFSGIKVYTDYVNSMSMDQNIYMRRVSDPLLTGYDVMAKEIHKGDGRFCYELFPMSKEDFEDQYGKKYSQNMTFKNYSNFGGVNWSYTTGNVEQVLVCHFYKKKIKQQKIIQLSNFQTMTVDDYEALIQNWSFLTQPPQPIGKSRKSDVTTITCHKICSDSLLETIEMPEWHFLPIIFVDGNSAMIKDSSGNYSQMTRPFCYHAHGIQKLKNFAGNSLANELENIVQHKFTMALESIDPEYKDALLNYQLPNLMIYRAFYNNDPNSQLPPPMPVPRVPAPPEVMSTFSVTDGMTQAILGSYDAQQGNISDAALSGEAIKQGTMNSNSTALPFSNGVFQALNQVGKIWLNLLPNIYVTPRTIPVLDARGQRNYIVINQEMQNGGQQSFDYDPNAFDISINASVSFEMQRQQALSTLVKLQQMNPTFAQFMATKAGIDLILDNLDIRGIDALKQGVNQFVQEQQAQQQAAMHQQMSPLVVKQQELQLKAQKMQSDAQLDSARIATEKQKADTDRILALSKIGESSDKITLEQDKLEAEKARTAVDGAIAMSQHHHDKAMDILEHHHKMQENQLDKENSKNNQKA